LNFIPIIYFYIIFLISLVLFIRKNRSKQYKIISSLIGLIGLGYLSTGVSSRGDIIGIFLICLTLWLIPILFIDYLNTLIPKKDEFYFTRFLYLTIALLIFLNVFWLNAMLTIPIFLFLIFILIYYFISKYKLIKRDINYIKLKMFFWTIFVSILPFIFLSSIPSVLFKKELLSFEYSSLFFLLIPFLFLYIAIQRVFFDIEYLFKKIAWNSLISLGIVTIPVAFLYLKELDVLIIFQFLILFLTVTVILSFIKEYFFIALYKKNRKIDKSITRISNITTKIKDKDKLFEYLCNEITNTLNLEYVSYVKYNTENHIYCTSFPINNNFFIQLSNKSKGKNLHIGNLISTNEGYALLVGKNNINYDLILFSFKKNRIKLNNKEIDWLHTIANYTNLLLENFKKTDELLQDVYNEAYSNHSTTASRLLIQLGEKERAKLSQDIHDSILQDLIFLYKNVELLLQDSEGIKTYHIVEIKNQLYNQINLIRETCYDLNPPFLKEIGLVDSLNTLFYKYKEAGDFDLYFQAKQEEIDPYLKQEIVVFIYRVIQELMVNAKKHSKAKYIFISLRYVEDYLVLLYEDDGIGFKPSKLSEINTGYGLASIQERIKGFNGEIMINSAPNQGLIIKITINPNYN